jgi:hypothetical protein
MYIFFILRNIRQIILQQIRFCGCKPNNETLSVMAARNPFGVCLPEIPMIKFVRKRFKFNASLC